MITEEIQAAREWSARLMRWVEIIPQFHAPTIYYGIASDDHTICSCRVIKANWQPDSDLNQTLMVIDKMRELGWWLSIEQSMLEPHEWAAQFFHRELDQEGTGATDSDFAHAILKAAMAILMEAI